MLTVLHHSGSCDMKLIGFSPWKHIATSVPQIQGGDSVAYRIVAAPSSNAISSKRTRYSLNQEKKNGKIVINEQPDLVLTTDHQISILGHTASPKKSLKGSTVPIICNVIKELPEWIYTSRPGDESAFIPKKSDQSPKIGAVIDANSRSVISLQKDNSIIKIWSLDSKVTGPDEDDNKRTVQRVEVPSPVVSLETIPYKQQTRVKIRGHDSTNTEDVAIEGGVTGVLDDGQIFVILILASRELKVGFYGKDDSSSGRTSRRSSNNGAKQNTSGIHILSVANYTSSNGSGYNADNSIGQKRKAETLENTGIITLTTLSLDPHNKDTILFCKHNVLLPASENMDKCVEDNELGGVYSKESGKLKLPHSIYSPNGKGKSTPTASNSVHVTQLDPTHVCMVYKSSQKTFLATILDIRYGERIVQPFPLILNSPDSTVLEVGGLSTSILAVLTSDNILSVYDVRRAILLHEMNLPETLRDSETEDEIDFQYGISTNWFSGTIGIIRMSAVSKGNSHDFIQASFAKVGIFDESSRCEDIGMGSKQLLKGTYNLAKAIASSMSTTAGKDLGIISADSAPLEQNMVEWLSITPPNAKSDESYDTEATKISERLVKYKSTGGKPNGKKESLGKILSDTMGCFGGKAQNKSPNCDTSCIPQRLIDCLLAASIDFVLSSDSSFAKKIDAAGVLMSCIKSGKFSGRTHFDKARNANSDVLRSLLFSFKKLYNNASEKRNISISPLNLVYLLLRYCEDSIPEHMLISMLHFILCHVDHKELSLHWTTYSEQDDWYSDSSTKVLEKRLKIATSEYEKVASDELKDLILSLEQRLATSQRLFFIESIVTHSKCNTALLRAAMRKGFTQSHKGEVEVLMQSLARLLRKTGKDKRVSDAEIDVPNASTSISKWLSALVDANLGVLLKRDIDNNTGSIEATKREISAAVSQTQALLGLKQLLDQAQITLEKNASDNKTKAMDVAPLPLYGIESLTF